MSKKNLIYVGNLEDLSAEEKERNCASYLRVLDTYANDRLMCNNIADVDESVWYNATNLYEDDEDDEEGEQKEIFQYFLCNLSEYEREKLIGCGIILSYSDMLDLDVIMVDHFGTYWGGVMTDTVITDNLDDMLNEMHEDEEKDDE